jgi:hypothetical protein
MHVSKRLQAIAATNSDTAFLSEFSLRFRGFDKPA